MPKIKTNIKVETNSSVENNTNNDHSYNLKSNTNCNPIEKRRTSMRNKNEDVANMDKEDVKKNNKNVKHFDIKNIKSKKLYKTSEFFIKFQIDKKNRELVNSNETSDVFTKIISKDDSSNIEATEILPLSTNNLKLHSNKNNIDSSNVKVILNIDTGCLKKVDESSGNINVKTIIEDTVDSLFNIEENTTGLDKNVFQHSNENTFMSCESNDINETQQIDSNYSLPCNIFNYLKDSPSKSFLVCNNDSINVVESCNISNDDSINVIESCNISNDGSINVVESCNISNDDSINVVESCNDPINIVESCNDSISVVESCDISNARQRNSTSKSKSGDNFNIYNQIPVSNQYAESLINNHSQLNETDFQSNPINDSLNIGMLNSSSNTLPKSNIMNLSSNISTTVISQVLTTNTPCQIMPKIGSLMQIPETFKPVQTPGMPRHNLPVFKSMQIPTTFRTREKIPTLTTIQTQKYAVSNQIPVTNSTSVQMPMTNSTSVEMPITNGTIVQMPMANSTSAQMPRTNGTIVQMPMANSTSVQMPITNGTIVQTPNTFPSSRARGSVSLLSSSILKNESRKIDSKQVDCDAPLEKNTQIDSEERKTCTTKKYKMNSQELKKEGETIVNSEQSKTRTDTSGAEKTRDLEEMSLFDYSEELNCPALLCKNQSLAFKLALAQRNNKRRYLEKKAKLLRNRTNSVDNEKECYNNTKNTDEDCIVETNDTSLEINNIESETTTINKSVTDDIKHKESTEMLRGKLNTLIDSWKKEIDSGNMSKKLPINTFKKKPKNDNKQKRNENPRQESFLLKFIKTEKKKIELEKLKNKSLIKKNNIKSEKEIENNIKQENIPFHSEHIYLNNTNTPQYCPQCKIKYSEDRPLRYYQISLLNSILLCTTDKCNYPFNTSNEKINIRQDKIQDILDDDTCDSDSMNTNDKLNSAETNNSNGIKFINNDIEVDVGDLKLDIIEMNKQIENMENKFVTPLLKMSFELKNKYEKILQNDFTIFNCPSEDNDILINYINEAFAETQTNSSTDALSKSSSTISETENFNELFSMEELENMKLEDFPKNEPGATPEHSIHDIDQFIQKQNEEIALMLQQFI